MSYDMLIRLMAKDEASPVFLKATSSVKTLDRDIAKLGDNQGFAGAEARAKGFISALEDARGKTENLDRVLGGIKNTAIGFGAAGTAGMMLSTSFINAAREGEKADKMLQAMMKKRGEGGRFQEMSDWASKLSMDAAMVDDDPIKEAAAGLLGFGLNAKQIESIMPNLIGQARTYGQDLKGVSEAFGRAFSSGNAGALKRSGVTLSKSDLDYVKAATSETEKQTRVFEVVKRSMDQYALSITEGMSEGEIAANRLQNSLDSMQTNMGIGAEKARSGLMGMLSGMVGLSNASTGVQQTAGYFFELGSEAVVAGASVVGFAAQLGQAKLGLDAFKAARAAGTAATVLATEAEVANAIATTASGNAAAAAAPKFGLLGRARALATGVGGAIVGGVALGGVGYEALRNSGAIDPEKHPGFFEAAKNVLGRGASNMIGMPGLYDRMAGEQGHIDAGNTAEAASLEYMHKRKAAGLSGLTTGAASNNALALQSALTDEDDSEEAAETESVTKEGKAAAKETAKAAREAAKHQKAAQRAAAKEERERQKIAKSWAKRADKLEDFAADVEAARMDAEYEVAIARLEASKSKKGDNSAIDAQIAQLQSEQAYREGMLRARTVGDDDPQRSAAMREMAVIKANKILDLSRAKAQGENPFTKAMKNIPALSYTDPMSIGGAMFNPYAGMAAGAYGDTTGAFARTIKPVRPSLVVDNYGRMTNGTGLETQYVPTPESANNRARAVRMQERARGRGTVTRGPSGNRILEVVFDKINIDMGRDEMDLALELYGY